MPVLGAGDPLRQLRRDRAFCKISIAGQDVTSILASRLMAISVIDTELEADEATIELDDKAPYLLLPVGAQPIAIELGWPKEGSFKVFNGYKDDIISNGQKRGGRTLTVHALAFNAAGKAKQPVQWSLGDGTDDKKLEDAMQKAAGMAGISVKVDPSLASKTRKFWMANNESFMAFGARIADEVGGVFKMSATNQATLSTAETAFNVLGQPLNTIIAETGLNLIAWSVHPNIARPQWSETSHTYFDPMAAEWKAETSQVTAAIMNPQASHTAPGPAADKDTAQQRAESDSGTSRREQGFGWVVIDGEPKAYGGATLVIQDTRPGVDGNYRMNTVEQIYNPQTGFTTRIDFHLPGYSGGGELGAP